MVHPVLQHVPTPTLSPVSFSASRDVNAKRDISGTMWVVQRYY